ncbi:hypothetical protein [Sphingomonas sp. LY160]|uniref:hypothetical protein n=1 Tax=Sphingomonas sp. LY160 TaxID=3095342 RepID=UPI002ADEDBE4|nr:hypothetical protein [Sphingomonas sp. LY160]MEA1072191.1 hypothetical protein [Sphingomonas sp. LY160]
MRIDRLQVEGGFLDGIDIKFSPGLNVIIGARGTGKTSVIELLRYVSGARNHSTDAEARSLGHARSILGGGEVTASMTDLIEDLLISRSAADDEPTAPTEFQPPLVFSQTEIETLGLSDAGRLRLLDNFVSGRAALRAREAAAISAVRSTFREIAGLEKELEAEAGPKQIQDLERAIDQLVKHESSFKSVSSDVVSKQQALKVLGSKSSDIAVQVERLTRFSAKAENLRSQLESLLEDDTSPELVSENGADQSSLLGLQDRYLAALKALRKVAAEFSRLETDAREEVAPLLRRRLDIDAKARTMRADIGKVADGAGAVARQLSQVRSELAQVQAREKLVSERRERLRMLRVRRDERLIDLEKIRAERFKRRSEAALEITNALAPQIRIDVVRMGQFADYAKALTEALRGSGMRSTDLVASVTERVSPRELIKFLDENDYVGLADAAQLARDRAARLLGNLKESGPAEVVTANIEDDVEMSLLDGVEYKPIETLSAGQRCTVILAMILQHTQRTLVIDQPEDHLDNAYIVSTVVKALHNRKSDSQIIISTHNANIPVLGGADLVIELTSDGRNGHVQVCGALEDSETVDAITNVMEGGRDAFSRRASFYNEHHL